MASRQYIVETVRSAMCMRVYARARAHTHTWNNFRSRKKHAGCSDFAGLRCHQIHRIQFFPEATGTPNMLGRAGSTVPLVTSPAEEESEPELWPIGAEEQGVGFREQGALPFCTVYRLMGLGLVWALLPLHGLRQLTHPLRTLVCPSAK